MPPERPPVAVVVPFYGSGADAVALRKALARLQRNAGDEVVVADNTEDGRFGPGDEQVRAVPAPLERSSYYARNVGTEATSAGWVLYIDSDTRPPDDLLRRYFDGPVAEDVGILAGAVRAAAGQTGTIPRYAASRRHIDPSVFEATAERRAAGITANLLVRRAAWQEVGGFHEGVRSGADLEFCWRVQDAGWRLERREAAWLEHEHVETVRRLARKAARHASGGGWVNDRYPGTFPRPRIGGGLLRAAAGVVVWTLTGKRERALFKGIDGVFLVADALGRTLGNRARRDPAPAPQVVAVATTFPRAGGGDGALASQLDADVHVLADRRAALPDRAARRLLRIDYAEEDGRLERVMSTARLTALHPACLARALREGASPRAVLRAAPAALRTAGWPAAQIRPLTADAAPRAEVIATLAGRSAGAPIGVQRRSESAYA